MLPSPVPADPGQGEDLAWLDRDPVTAAEFEASLDRLCERDEGPGEDEDEDYYPPLTAAELAGIDEAAADELLAATAATTGRRGPGQPGSARIFPGESCSPAAAFGPGMPWTCCRAAPGWRWPRTPLLGTSRVRRCLGGGAGRGDVRVGPGGGPRACP